MAAAPEEAALGYRATVRVTGSAGRFEDFRERVRWLLVREPDCDAFTEHHAPDLLEYRFDVVNGLPFPSFVTATAEFPELRVEVEWDQEGKQGGAAIENGRLVEKWTGPKPQS